MTFHIHRQMVYQYLLAGGGQTESETETGWEKVAVYKVRGGGGRVFLFSFVSRCVSVNRTVTRERSREGERRGVWRTQAGNQTQVATGHAA